MELIVTLSLLQSFPVQHSILHSSKVQLSYALKARVICAQAAALSVPKSKLSVNKRVFRYVSSPTTTTLALFLKKLYFFL